MRESTERKKRIAARLHRLLCRTEQNMADIARKLDVAAGIVCPWFKLDGSGATPSAGKLPELARALDPGCGIADTLEYILVGTIPDGFDGMDCEVEQGIDLTDATVAAAMRTLRDARTRELERENERLREQIRTATIQADHLRTTLDPEAEAA